MKQPRQIAAVFLTLLAGVLFAVPVWGPVAEAQAARPAIKGLGSQDALLVVAPGGRTIIAHNPDNPMVPASTLKVLTSLAALHYLGAGYRFPTDFLLDDRGNLGIRGFGDPLMVSEVIADIARQLSGRLPTEISTIRLDDSYFDGPLSIPGVSASTNPYDAPVGALCANFNTVFFTHVNGRPQSAEDQTPLLPMIMPAIQASGLRQGRIVLSNHHEAPLYAGHLFRFFLVKEGLKVRAVRMAPHGKADGRLIFRHASPYDLPQVIQRLLEFSNNFTANQLLFAMGAKCYGPPATLDKGVRALKAYAEAVVGIPKGVFVEGSGISRRNRLSAMDMDAVLAQFAPHAHLMSHKGREYYKTGTLKGIRTRVGYIETGAGGHYRFVLFRNHAGKATGPVMQQLHRFLKDNPE